MSEMEMQSSHHPPSKDEILKSVHLSYTLLESENAHMKNAIAELTAERDKLREEVEGLRGLCEHREEQKNGHH